MGFSFRNVADLGGSGSVTNHQRQRQPQRQHFTPSPEEGQKKNHISATNQGSRKKMSYVFFLAFFGRGPDLVLHCPLAH
jgi:hypothetical protein